MNLLSITVRQEARQVHNTSRWADTHRRTQLLSSTVRPREPHRPAASVQLTSTLVYCQDRDGSLRRCQTSVCVSPPFALPSPHPTTLSALSPHHRVTAPSHDPVRPRHRIKHSFNITTRQWEPAECVRACVYGVYVHVCACAGYVSGISGDKERRCTISARDSLLHLKNRKLNHTNKISRDARSARPPRLIKASPQWRRALEDTKTACAGLTMVVPAPSLWKSRIQRDP